ncbi:MAG: multiprotein bridging factor aMBF1 [Archaeoglobaceae archaeon]|nr:multiprotein bridging factor aMBF1 [Archaeoglobaceae archaeon]MCX8151605.1 multiprotein bridging factor aMBF1 [Archaeoglobaceae archaeon]MDW8013117.1 multiprotein bridging factor aMBF1 [Archaeoglobaceae archaeon]
MDCEICGKKIEKGYKVIVEGCEVTVCSSCKQLGIEKPILPKQSKTVQKKRQQKTKIEFEYELVEDFHEIIKKEREKRGWSQAELAKKIQEKESIIKKIENRELVPEKELIEKLERLFSVKLKENIPDIRVESKKSLTLTFGDVAVLRKKEK